MLRDIGYYGDNISFRSWIENCFNATFVACSSLQQAIDNYRFADPEEGIWLFGTLKPKLDAAMEYFVLLYSAELFEPDDEEEKMNYWSKELRRHQELFIGHEADSSRTEPLMAREKYLEYVQHKIVRLLELRP